MIDFIQTNVNAPRALVSIRSSPPFSISKEQGPKHKSWTIHKDARSFNSCMEGVRRALNEGSLVLGALAKWLSKRKNLAFI